MNDPASSPTNRSLADRVRSRFGRRALIALPLVLIPVGLLGWLIVRNWEALLAYPWRFRPAALLAAFALYTLALAVAIFTWGGIMHALSEGRNWRAHVRIYALTNLARRIPGMIWYFVGRISLYQGLGVTRTAVSLGSIVEFLLTLVAGILLSLALWPVLTPGDFGVWPLLIALAAAVLLCQPRLLRRVGRLLARDPAAEFRLTAGGLLTWVTFYAATWLSGGLYFAALSYLVVDITWSQLPAFLAAWCISGVVATVATLSPGGFGLREISMTGLLALFLPTEVALSLALLSRVALTLFEIFWAIIAYYLLATTSGLQELSQMGYRQ